MWLIRPYCSRISLAGGWRGKSISNIASSAWFDLRLRCKNKIIFSQISRLKTYQMDTRARTHARTPLCENSSSKLCPPGGDTTSQTPRSALHLLLLFLSSDTRGQQRSQRLDHPSRGALNKGGPPGIHERIPIGKIVFHDMFECYNARAPNQGTSRGVTGWLTGRESRKDSCFLDLPSIFVELFSVTDRTKKRICGPNKQWQTLVCLKGSQSKVGKHWQNAQRWTC